MPKLMKKYLEKLNKSYKNIFKTSGCRILSTEEIQNINDNIDQLSSSDVKIIKAAQNRNYAKFAKIAMFEPSTSQEAKDMFKEAFEVSEYGAPLTEEIKAKLFPF